MMRCRIAIIRATLPVFLLLAAGPLGYAEQFPLPGDVEELPQPYELTLGSRPVQAQGFSTRLSLEQLRAFYEQALPQQGWDIRPLPWAAQFQDKVDELERLMEEQPELADDPQVAEQLASIDTEKIEQFMRRAIYAVRGTEHVLLTINPQGARTLVFVNRWEEPVSGARSSQDAPPGFLGVSPADGDARAGWPAVNPCCGDEEVPGALRKLPNSIPRYPNGRLTSTGGSASQRAMSEMYLTEDAPATIADYYRQQMTYNGWSRIESVPEDQDLGQLIGQAGLSMSAKALAFRNTHGVCHIVAVAQPQGVGVLGAAGAGAAPFDAAGQGQAASRERTFITVTYLKMNTDFLSGRSRAVPAAVASPGTRR